MVTERRSWWCLAIVVTVHAARAQSASPTVSASGSSLLDPKKRNEAETRMQQLIAEMHALASLVAPSTLKQVSSQLLSMRGVRSERSGNVAGAGVSRKVRVEGEPKQPKLPKLLRSAPLLFADEQPRRLCAAKPPWGLLSKDVSQLGAPANWSRLPHTNRTRDHFNLCVRYVERLQQSARTGARPPLPWNRSCAIVGSGGTLRGGGNGRLIDGHAMVMRFNAAPAGSQWATDVGSKTTLRLFTDKTIAVSAKRSERSSGEGLLLYCMATWVGKCVHAGVRAPTPKAAKLWLVNPVFVRHLRSHLDEHGGRGRLPSAGLVGISHALSSCSRVSLFGFGNASDTNTTGTCGHYWECNRNQSKYFAGKQGYHEWKAQWRLLSQWLEQRSGGSATGQVAFH